MLFLSPRYPHPATRGDQRRVLNLVQALTRHAEVTLATFGAGQPLPFPGVRVESVARSLGGALAANLASPRPGIPLQVRLYLDERMERLVRRELRRSNPHVVHATLARMAPYLPRSSACHRHFDLVDALSVNMDTRADASSFALRPVFRVEAALMRRFEADAVARAESSSVVSASDLAAAPELTGTAVVPNGVDTREFPFLEPADRAAQLLFFGNLGYFHNAEPARFVASRVLPLLRRHVPGARLRIVGARPAPGVAALQRLEGVEVVGPVKSMASELHQAAVAVVPMFSGTGMKNKVLEAFSAGTPVVTNRLGIQGIEGAQPGRHYLAGENAESLASSCAELLGSPRRRETIAAEAHRLVERRFTWDRQAESLLGLYGLGGA